ncbi:MAG: ammonium transporter [Planctomycetes bacterium]|nr:ammonium transporter [Planctomycetota bacterium]
MRLCQKLGVALCALTLLTALAGRACAEDEAKEPSSLEEKVATLQSDLEAAKTDSAVGVDTLWVLIAGFLVFFMNAGFGCVEAGFCRAKNAVNILGKNFVVFGISSLAFWIIGWTIMFSAGDYNDYFGNQGWVLSGADNSPATGDDYEGVYGSIKWTGIPLLAKFFFQLVFAGTAATIVSGCVAERIHYKSYMVFTVFLVALSYPITGHWIWGGGWLSSLGFWDFAGSTVVHSVGGWAGLAGIILLGSRIGKYRDGKPRAIPGHSMALAFLGGLILWLGWFGFNPGSTMAIAGADGAASVAHIVITTNLSCAGGLLSATILAWVMLGKPDFSMTINGALAGLVAITAPCAYVTPGASVIIGVVAGVIVVFSVIGFDRIKIDDPVGALSVHLSNGIWGTLAIGLFANPVALDYEPGPGKDGPLAGLFYGGGFEQLQYQVIGVLAVGAITFGLALVVWFIIKVTIGLRVDPDAEMRGLDVSEMGMEAYSPDVVA